MPKKYNLKKENNTNAPTVHFEAVKVFPYVNLSSKIPIMYDQGNLGCCTANALCYAYIANDNKYNPSRIFLYYNERKLDMDIPDDAGSTLSQGITALKKYGVCTEISCPYIQSKFAIKPSNAAYSEGLKHEVIQASIVKQTLQSLKGCLTSGEPFVVGIQIYDSFESDAVAANGIVPMPDVQNENLLGGHAVICVGYDDGNKWWIMKNSWGDKWGANGYFYLPYAYLTNLDLAGDIWKITKVNTFFGAENRTKIAQYVILQKHENNKHKKK